MESKFEVTNSQTPESTGCLLEQVQSIAATQLVALFLPVTIQSRCTFKHFSLAKRTSFRPLF